MIRCPAHAYTQVPFTVLMIPCLNKLEQIKVKRKKSKKKTITKKPQTNKTIKKPLNKSGLCVVVEQQSLSYIFIVAFSS